jgi:hypothetical protein
MKNIFQSIKNIFQSKKNLTWFSEKYLSFILGGKHIQEVVKKIRNIILFAEYNKFGPQTFD